MISATVTSAGSTFTQFPDRRLCVEVPYTRDRVVDRPDGSWETIPHPPSAGGWFLWDPVRHERKTGWLRVWGKGSSPPIIFPGEAE